MRPFRDTRPSQALLVELAALERECAVAANRVNQIDVERQGRLNLIEELNARGVTHRQAARNFGRAARRLQFAAGLGDSLSALAGNLTLTLGSLGSIVVVVTLAVATAAVGLTVLRASTSATLISSVLFGIVGGAAWGFALSIRRNGRLAGWVACKKTDAERVRRQADASAQSLADASMSLKAAQQELERLSSAFEGEQKRSRDLHLNRDALRQQNAWYHWLCSQDFATMEGLDFERYLRDLFEFLGYSVQMQGGQGDQGADLIIARNGRRTCIQAKRHTQSVTNAAVQQVNAARTLYKCHACAVVTNSRFTKGAVEIAEAVKCTLIDGSQIRQLIDGKIEL